MPNSNYKKAVYIAIVSIIVIVSVVFYLLRNTTPKQNLKLTNAPQASSKAANLASQTYWTEGTIDYVPVDLSSLQLKAFFVDGKKYLLKFDISNTTDLLQQRKDTFTPVNKRFLRDVGKQQRKATVIYRIDPAKEFPQVIQVIVRPASKASPSATPSPKK